MLQAHSLLWHYLWLAPDILQAGLALFLWCRGFHKIFPIFFAYAIYEAIETFTLYTLDILPSVSAKAYWAAFWIAVITGALVKFATIGELLHHVLRTRPPVARMGNRLFALTGVGLTLLAVLAAAYTSPHNPHWFIGGALLLQQTVYIVQCGLVLFVFLFAAYFKLTWDRLTFGVAFGFAIVFCQHLACRALEVAVALPNDGVLLDFMNMATYHVCVLIWFYYFLVPQKIPATSAVSLHEDNLANWNRELERLLER